MGEFQLRYHQLRVLAQGRQRMGAFRRLRRLWANAIELRHLHLEEVTLLRVVYL